MGGGREQYGRSDTISLENLNYRDLVKDCPGLSHVTDMQVTVLTLQRHQKKTKTNKDGNRK